MAIRYNIMWFIKILLIAITTAFLTMGLLLYDWWFTDVLAIMTLVGGIAIANVVGSSDKDKSGEES